jgi:hypothetical protein
MGSSSHDRRGRRNAAATSTVGSDLTAIQQGIDVALRLGFLQAILRDHLRDEIILVLERGQLVLGEFAPFGADLLENDLLGLSSGRRMSCGRVQV